MTITLLISATLAMALLIFMSLNKKKPALVLIKKNKRSRRNS